MKTNDMKHSKTSKQLLKAGRHVTVPFELSLMDADALLHCEQILRIIPGKRLVVMGRWNDQAVVAKIFYSRKATQHIQDDVNGVEELVRSGIPTPAILFKGQAQDKKIQVVLFERILESATLDYLWREKHSVEEMIPTLKKVTLELATQHVMGIVQKDLHLKNFLLASNQLYTLDGGDIIQSGGVLSKEHSIEHFALFLSQLGAGCSHLHPELFAIYSTARGWNIKEADRAQLEKMIREWNTLRWEQYQKKIMRSSTAFEKISRAQQLTVYDRDYVSAEFLDFIKNPNAIFNHPDAKILKAGRSSTVIKVDMAGKQFVIKRYNLKNPWHWLRRCLRSTRAMKSWRLAHQLRLFFIPTAKPVAFIQNRFLGLSGTSYFVTEYVAGPHIGEYFSQHADDKVRSKQMALQAMALLQNLAALSLTHGDLKMTNILIANEQPLLIDLDGAVSHRTEFGLKRALQQEVLRFLKNWQDAPSIRALFEGEATKK